MIPVIALWLTLIVGIRRPGVILAGCFFTYQASSAANIPWLGEAYVAVAAALMIGRAAIKRSPLKMEPVDLALLALLAWNIAGVAYAPDETVALEALLRILLSVGGMYGVARWSCERFDVLMRQCTVAIAVLGAVFAISLYAERSLLQQTRLVLAEGDATAVGLAQAFPFGILASVAIVLFARKWYASLFGALCLAIILYVALASATRGVFVAGIAGFLVLLVMGNRHIRWNKFVVGGATVVGGVMVTLSVMPADRLDAAIDRLFGSFAGEQFKYDPSSLVRLEGFGVARDLFVDKPILGQGLSGYGQLSDYGYPHNMFMEIASELGLVGLSLSLIWLSLLAMALLRLSKSHPVAAAIAGAFTMAAFVHMQLSFTFYMGKPLFLLSALVTAALYVERKAARAAKRARRKPRLTTSSISRPDSIAPRPKSTPLPPLGVF